MGGKGRQKTSGAEVLHEQSVRGSGRSAKRQSLLFSVAEYMFTLITVSPDDAPIGALEKVIKNNLGDLPVVDENGILPGELNGFEILMHGTDFLG